MIFSSIGVSRTCCKWLFAWVSLKVRGMLMYDWIEDDEMSRNPLSEFLYHVPEGCGDPIYIGQHT